MFEHRGRPRSPRHPPAGAAAVSGVQRFAIATVVNVLVLVAWAAEPRDSRRDCLRRRCVSECPRT